MEFERSGTAVVHSEGLDPDGHRGMFLIEQLSADWGAERTSSGKRVWARLGPRSRVSG